MKIMRKIEKSYQFAFEMKFLFDILRNLLLWELLLERRILIVSV